MMSFLAAAFYGTSWSVLRELGETALGQGFGLAIMAALPLYTCGAVLGGMSAACLTDGRGPRVGPGAAATTGAAIGFLITGFMLPRAPVPSHLLIVCLLLLSVGGVWYRVLLGSHLHIDVKASESSAKSRVRVEDRRLLADGVASRILLEGEHVRRTARLSGENEVVPWDIAVARGLMPLLGVPWRVLVVGGGVSPLPRMVVREHPIASVEVLERVGAVVEFGRDHFDTGLHVGHTERSSVAVGNLDDLVEGLSGSYDLVVVDSAALEVLGGREGLSRRSRAILRQRISADGVLVWGPDADPAQDAVTGWSTLALARAGEGGEEEVVLVAGPEAALASIDVIEGFRVLNGGAAIT